MESILLSILNRVREQMPFLSVIDEDYGQLENIDEENVDMYPLTFPAVLVETTRATWDNTAALAQRGTASVRVRLVVDCYDDTHIGSTTEDKITEREELRRALYKALQGFRPSPEGAMIRTESKFFTWKHGIKVYESYFDVSLSEQVRETRRVDRPRVSLSAALENP